MAGTLHAIVLLSVLVGTGFALALSRRRVPSSRNAAQAFAITGIAAVVLLLTGWHLCGAGIAAIQWVLPLACAWIAFIYLERPAIRRSVAGTLLACALALTLHYNHLVHGKEWTGNRAWPESIFRNDRRADLAILTMRLGELAETYTGSYVPSWVRDLPFAEQIANLPRRSRRSETHQHWHSSFTRLNGKAIIAQDYWYPGGALTESADKIEVRDRPTPPQSVR